MTKTIQLGLRIQFLRLLTIKYVVSTLVEPITETISILSHCWHWNPDFYVWCQTVKLKLRLLICCLKHWDWDSAFSGLVSILYQQIKTAQLSQMPLNIKEINTNICDHQSTLLPSRISCWLIFPFENIWNYVNLLEVKVKKVWLLVFICNISR